MANKIIIKSLVVVCIFMQTLTLLPHHHHGENNLPCINFFHCTNDSSGSTCGHDHEGCRGHEAEDHDQNAGCQSENHKHDADNYCSFEHKDVIGPRDEMGKVFIADFLFCGILSVDDSQNSDRSRYESQISLLADKLYLGAPPLHMHYITQAIPSRAPSFTA